MIHDGETVTFRSDRPARHAPRPAQPRQAERPVERASERPAPGSERLARLEGAVARLEGAVVQLAERLQEVVASAESAPPRVEVRERPREQVREQVREQADEPGGTYTSPDVKVSMFGGETTRAVVGQVRVRHQG